MSRGKYPLQQQDINLMAIHHLITDALSHNRSYVEWHGEITEEMYVYIKDRNLKLERFGYTSYIIYLH